MRDWYPETLPAIGHRQKAARAEADFLYLYENRGFDQDA
jgi:hypothetical protein